MAVANPEFGKSLRDKRTFSRRSFLKTAVVAGLGAIAGGALVRLTDNTNNNLATANPAPTPPSESQMPAITMTQDSDQNQPTTEAMPDASPTVDNSLDLEPGYMLYNSISQPIVYPYPSTWEAPISNIDTQVDLIRGLISQDKIDTQFTIQTMPAGSWNTLEDLMTDHLNRINNTQRDHGLPLNINSIQDKKIDGYNATEIMATVALSSLNDAKIQEIVRICLIDNKIFLAKLIHTTLEPQSSNEWMQFDYMLDNLKFKS